MVVLVVFAQTPLTLPISSLDGNLIGVFYCLFFRLEYGHG